VCHSQGQSFFAFKKNEDRILAMLFFSVYFKSLCLKFAEKKEKWFVRLFEIILK
jgi:hypothetical protein